jgi:eukaryotic-like serine/threonine-protein kinase
VGLTPGARIGPYEVTALIGEGGMGEVYRATDTNLKRAVALKVLPAPVSGDADRLARFRREAEVLAALNDPHIAHIYGLEKSEGVTALVMELVEGETLADHIARGAIPVDEALPIAKQIAEALEAAHEQGIIHRDLKPANIKVRPDGTVKVLDFGLAKLTESGSGQRVGNASMSPTITSPALMSGVGVMLGTAAYMSPEQVRGKTVDKRADIWAFGCVLYEMFTGTRPFDGDDVAVVLASAIKSEPNWSALPTDVPTPVVTLIRSCLEKDPKNRISAMGAATFVLQHVSQLVQRVAAPSSAKGARDRSKHWRTTLLAVAVVSLLLVAGAGWMRMRPGPLQVARTIIATSGSTALNPTGLDRDIAITADGSRIVYRGNNQLLVRPLNQLDPVVLSGLGAPRGVFISPDGQWVGFFDPNVMKKVAITGGPPVEIARVDGGGTPRGATWGPDGTIIFATASPGTGLQKVSSAGGEPTVLTKPDRAKGEVDHLWPEFLPGGQAVLFTISAGTTDNSQIAVLDLRTGATKILIRGGSHAQYVPTGHIVYGAAGNIRAVGFDVRRAEVTSAPVPALQGVMTNEDGSVNFAVSANGSLAYVPGGVGGAGARVTVMSVDRQGKAAPLPGLRPDSYRDVQVSPDGTRLLLTTQQDVWIYDLMRATLTRLTTDPAADTRAVWTTDAQRIVFTSDRAGFPEIFWRSADGTGRDERLLSRDKALLDLRATGWSPDGKRLVFTEVVQNIQCAIEQIDTATPADVTVLVKNEFCNDWGTVSPDGRWLAYESNVSGRYEIYTERYPELGNRQQISTDGGRRPIWSRDGRALFFSSDNRQIFAVPIQSTSTLTAGKPQALFDFPLNAPGGSHPYDRSRDGVFFLIRSGQETGGAGVSNIVLIQNWFAELNRLMSAN